MKYLFLDPRSGKVLLGNNLAEVVCSHPGYQIDLLNRRVILDNRPDTMTISTEYSDEELVKECHRRVKTLLLRNGWQFYKNEDLFS